MNRTERIQQQMMEEMEDLSLDEAQDSQDESMINQQEFQEAYGVPEPEQSFNKHAFLFESLKQDNPEKVTFLHSGELGRPLFTVRFMLDMEDIAISHLDDLLKKYNLPNKISSYFRAKIENTADSGMSNEGFIQKLNVTQKIDMKRTRVKNLANLQGGKMKHG